MKKYAMGFVAAVVLALPAAWAQTRTLPPISQSPTTIRLVCSLSYSLGENGTRTEVEGEELWTITYRSDGSATFKRSDLDAEFRGTVTDDEIAGVAAYDLEGTKGVRERIGINRYTGEYRRLLAVGDASSVFVGECRAAERKF